MELKFIGICLHHHAAFNLAANDKRAAHADNEETRRALATRWLRAEFGPAQLMLDESDDTPVKRYPLFHLSEIAAYIKSPHDAIADINAPFPPEPHGLSALTQSTTAFAQKSTLSLATEFRKANGLLKLAIMRYARGAYNLADFPRPTPVRAPLQMRDFMNDPQASAAIEEFLAKEIMRSALASMRQTLPMSPLPSRAAHLPPATRKKLEAWETTLVEGILGNIPLPKPLPRPRLL